MNKNRWTIRKDPSYLAAQAHPTSTGNPTENRLLFSLPLNSSAPGSIMQNDGCAVQEPLATTHHSDDTEAARQVMVSVPERSRLRNDSERACLQKHEDERH